MTYEPNMIVVPIYGIDLRPWASNRRENFKIVNEAATM
jgi:hypothetical protein